MSDDQELLNHSMRYTQAVSFGYLADTIFNRERRKLGIRGQPGPGESPLLWLVVHACEPDQTSYLN